MTQLLLLKLMKSRIFINNYHSDIQFTIAIEQNNQFPFLCSFGTQCENN